MPYQCKHCERLAGFQSLCGGAWFVENLWQRLPPGSWDGLSSQRRLFDAAAKCYEDTAIKLNKPRGNDRRFNWPPIDPKVFGRLVELAQRRTEDILFGYSLMTHLNYREASPQRRDLQNYIQSYLWREWFDRNPNLQTGGIKG